MKMQYVYNILLIRWVFSPTWARYIKHEAYRLKIEFEVIEFLHFVRHSFWPYKDKIVQMFIL